MSYDDIVSGSVIEYSYLWSREEKNGETEGRKQRPCTVIIRKGDKVWILAITTKPPLDGEAAIKIPELEAVRMGLNGFVTSWVQLTEYNTDSIPSYVLEPNSKIGQTSHMFLKKIATQMRESHKKMLAVKRDD